VVASPQAADLGVAPSKIVLIGHSAGAQLAAMCLVQGWLPDPLQLAELLICAAVLLSGLYELEPSRQNSIGHDIGLSRAEVAAHSVLRHLHPGVPPLILAHGEDEPSGFADQQRWLVAGATGLSIPVTEVVVPGRNHLELSLGIADPADPVGRVVRALIEPVGSPHRGTR
jgi:arylformamidase